ncbi:MAG: exodeoxyribonuclease III [Bacteroidia bacterium]|nr:exodeoxyribonuclease III [Bacteroidota bacterium]MBP6412222.1 exodeoxyribonuclease III [Bacteroidia bacterium]
MKTIISYNVNGIRAAINKNFLEWLKNVNPDILCLQEIKANPDQFDSKAFESLGYNYYSYPAQKKGYSGVAILSKTKPDAINYGCGIAKYDDEGRVLRADFGKVSVMSVYHPSGSSGEERQAFKMQWLSDFKEYISVLKKEKPKLILCGDFNICNKAIDIHNPKSNANTSGFLPEERAWFDSFLETGFIDSFREFNKEPHNYSWWSYRANAREKNLGWRIDYNLISKELVSQLKGASILPDAKHSDHCPVVINIDF